jgi:RNA polymerase sigma factor (sigma-70 family)
MRNDDLTRLVASLREAIRQLSPREREAVRLRFVDGLPLASIARRLKMPRRTVTTLIMRMRRQLCE